MKMILKGFFPFPSSKCINYLQCKLSTNYSSYFISTKLINEDFQRRGFVLCNLRKLLISDFKIKNLDYWKYYVQYIKEKRCNNFISKCSPYISSTPFCKWWWI